IAFLVGTVLGFAPPRGNRMGRLLGGVGLLALVLQPLFWLALTGRARTNGAIHKWIFLDPYLAREHMWLSVLERLRILRDWLLGMVEVPYLPKAVIAALLAIGVVGAPFLPLGSRLRRWTLIGLVLTTALGLVAPTTYVTFSWHHFR